MLRFIVLTVALAAITSAEDRTQRSYNQFEYSAASPSQIKNAIENNYDDTGPGSKSPEQAYKTFKTLEEALVNYLDDPDTKLPDHERAKAIQRLVKPVQYNSEPFKYYPKITNEYSKWIPVSQAEPISILNKFGFSTNREAYNHYLPYNNDENYKGVEENNLPQIESVGLPSYPRQQPYKVQAIKSVKGSPINLAHYTRAQLADNEFNPNPQYSFSYGVHVGHTCGANPGD